ncbi:hypothetical protein [Deinococcus hopiensis]|uniref:hypothetical protein n=1 Tax=Deinococcus hopiensis TaxID=309885 RepID=UPI000A05B11C|nr:hypothetical protein [Deinococcus hopiensis]
MAVTAPHAEVVNNNFGNESQGLLGAAFSVVKRLTGILPGRGAETGVFPASSPEVGGVRGKSFGRKRAVNTSKESCGEGEPRHLGPSASARRVQADGPRLTACLPDYTRSTL